MKTIKRAGTALLLSLFASPAVAVMCESIDHDRYMDLAPDEGTATCAGSGTGMPDNKTFHEDMGLFEIEKLEDDVSSGDWITNLVGLNGTSGSIDFATNLYSSFSDVHVAFKYGNNHTPPDWISYQISGVFSAEWEVFQGDNDYALSNVTLWGKDGVSVPTPGVVSLLGIGLLGLGAFARRRQA